MKQGRADRSGRESTKVEPTSKAKNVGKVADMGLQVVRTRNHKELGRGFMAPAPKATTTHKGGSQRKS
jgi:hypothetical protein